MSNPTCVRRCLLFSSRLRAGDSAESQEGRESLKILDRKQPTEAVFSVLTIPQDLRILLPTSWHYDRQPQDQKRAAVRTGQFALPDQAPNLPEQQKAVAAQGRSQMLIDQEIEWKR